MAIDQLININLKLNSAKNAKRLIRLAANGVLSTSHHSSIG